MPEILLYQNGKRREHLSETLPGLQTAWDATSLADFQRCPRYYFYSRLCGLRPKQESHHLTFGRLYHHGLELYDGFILSGLPHEEAQHEMVHRMLVESEDYPEDADPKRLKTRDNLIRTLVWYTEEYREDKFKTHQLASGKAALELSFRLLLQTDACTGEPYRICGHFDKVAEQAGGLFIMDRKTTGRTLSDYYFKDYTPDVQMTFYALAGQIVLERPISGVIVDAAQLAIGFSRFARGIITRTKGTLEEFYAEFADHFAVAELYAKRGSWPCNRTSCEKYGGCAFRTVCGADPAVREHFLRSDFKLDPWNPLEER